MKEQTTKERILDAAEEIMLDRGFRSVGLNQILTAVNVPKGSFYHYFKSKDDFGVQMLKHYLLRTTNRKREMLLSPVENADPLGRLFSYLDSAGKFLEQTPGKFPCLVLKMASEATDLTDAMRVEMSNGIEEWIGIFKKVLDEAVAQKSISPETNTALEASLIQDLWSGATQRAVINLNAEPVFNAVAHMKTRIEKLS